MAESIKELLKPKVRFSQSDSTADSEITKLFPGLKIKSVVSMDKPVKLIHNFQETNNYPLETEEQFIRNINYDNFPDNLICQPSTSTKTIETGYQSQEKTSLASKSIQTINTDVGKAPESDKKGLETRIADKEFKRIAKSEGKDSVKVPGSKKANKENLGRSGSKGNNRVIQLAACNRKRALQNSKVLAPKPPGTASVAAKVASKASKVAVQGQQSRKVAEKSSKSSATLKVREKALENEVKVVKNVEKLMKTREKSAAKIEISKQVKKQVLKTERSVENKANPFLNKAIQRDVAGVLSNVKTAPGNTKKPLLTRSKTQVKVVTTRNMAGSKPNVYVGPGTLRNRARSLPSVSNVKAKSSNGICTSGSSNLLNRPEYNSIIGTINKLEEVKKKKIVSDIDQLPPDCKSQVLKKVSKALDFPPDKPIFRDLIDLSFNESLLPKRIMRSKDPPPRPKDLQPSLSDFFTPQHGKEFVEAVTMKPRAQEIADKWNTFRISDLIFSWKARLDENDF